MRTPGAPIVQLASPLVAVAASPFDRFLERLRALSERERLMVDAVAVVRERFGPRHVSAWLTDEHRAYRRVAAADLDGATGLPDLLPEPLATAFPAHADAETPLGSGLAPLLLSAADWSTTAHSPAAMMEELHLLDAQLLLTLPGPQMVQGVLLLGARADKPYDVAATESLLHLAREVGRALANPSRPTSALLPLETRVKPPAHLIARLEEELARAERFKRGLTILWVAIDLPPGTDDAAAGPIVNAVGEWLGATLRVMDTVGRRSERAFVAVLPETTRAGGELLKSRLAALSAEHPFGLPRPARARLRLRVGLASYPEEGVSSRFLLLAAERDAEGARAAIESAPGAGDPSSPRPLLLDPTTSTAPVACSNGMREVLELAQQVAASKLTVLVTGETGVGKERLAEFIRVHSDRGDKPEVRLNCGAIPETMIEAEFFGFERGSFTGAIRSTRGKFELADGGTLFLDEIGELSMAMQVKLLRVLDEQRFYRLGASSPVQVDVRVIAITNRDLSQDVAMGRFREDLFYRLNVVTIRIPPLRERPEDIPPLVDRLIVEFCTRTNLPLKKLALEGYDLLYSYPWRGNVRELRNVIERSVVVSRGSYITADDLIRAVPELSAARTTLMRPPPKPAANMRNHAGRQREQGVLDLIRRRPDIGLREILKEVGTSKSTGIRLVNELIARGQVVRRDRGKRSRYRLAETPSDS